MNIYNIEKAKTAYIPKPKRKVEPCNNSQKLKEENKNYQKEFIKILRGVLV